MRYIYFFLLVNCFLFSNGCDENQISPSPGYKWANNKCNDQSKLQTKICNPILSIKEQKADFTIIRTTIEGIMPDLYLRFSQDKVKQLMDSMQNTFTVPLSVLDFYRKTAPFIDQFACSHTNFQLNSNLIDSITGCAIFLPYALYYTHNTVFLNDYMRSNSMGGKVLSINGIKTENRLLKLDQYIYSDLTINSQRYYLRNKLAFYNYIAYPDENRIDLLVYTDSLKKIGSGFSLFQSINEGFFRPLYIENDCYINDTLGIATLTINTFDPAYSNGSTFDNFLKNSMELIQLKKVNKLIIDLRDNCGGMDYHELELRSFFSSDTVRTVKKDKIRIKYLPFDELARNSFQSFNIIDMRNKIQRHFYKVKDWGYECFIDSIYSRPPRKIKYSGEILVLINEGTGSAALRLAYYLRSFTNCKIAGQSPPSRATYSNGGYNINYELTNSKIVLTLPLYYRENFGNSEFTDPNGQLKIDYPIEFSRQNFISKSNPYTEFADKYFRQ